MLKNIKIFLWSIIAHRISSIICIASYNHLMIMANHIWILDQSVLHIDNILWFKEQYWWGLFIEFSGQTVTSFGDTQAHDGVLSPGIPHCSRHAGGRHQGHPGGDRFMVNYTRFLASLLPVMNSTDQSARNVHDRVLTESLITYVGYDVLWWLLVVWIKSLQNDGTNHISSWEDIYHQRNI